MNKKKSLLDETKILPMVFFVLVILISGCISSEPINFYKTTVEDILKNPDSYENKSIVVEGKKFSLYYETAPDQFWYRVYDANTGELVKDSDAYSISTLPPNNIVIGDQNKIVVYNYNREWAYLSQEVMADPSLIGYPHFFTDKFYNDVYFDFYGVIELEPICTCRALVIDSWGDNYWESKWGPAFSEYNGLKKDCYEADKKSLERMEVYRKEGTSAGHYGFGFKIEDEIKDYFLDQNGNPKDTGERLLNVEGEWYLFPTFSCKEGSGSKLPVMKFVDSKIKYSVNPIWDLNKVGCYETHSPGLITGIIKKLARCKTVERSVVN